MRHAARKGITTLVLFAGLALAILARAPSPPETGDRFAPRRALPTDRLAVALLGTSLTSGTHLPNALERRLESCLGIPVAVRTFAQPGATSDQGMTQLAALPARVADIVLIEFAINDADTGIGMPFDQSKAQHEALIRIMAQRHPGTAITLVTTNPTFERMAERRPALRAYYSMYRDLASAHDLGLADLHARWMDTPDPGKLIPDGLHPSEEATDSLTVPSLAEHIASTFGRSC